MHTITQSKQEHNKRMRILLKITLIYKYRNNDMKIWQKYQTLKVQWTLMVQCTLKHNIKVFG